MTAIRCGGMEDEWKAEWRTVDNGVGRWDGGTAIR